MPSVRRYAEESSQERPKVPRSPLPLRWAVIIAVSAGVGFATSGIAEPVAGITVAIALAALLHKVLA